MKKIAIIILSLLVTYTSFAQQETWDADNAHSNLRFEVGWEDFSMRTGEFKVFDGTIVTKSKDDLTDAEIEFKVDATSVDVISERLEMRVKNDKFLDVENFPEIKFVANKVVRSSDSTYVATGKLKIRDVELDQEVSIWVKGSKESKRGGYIYGLEVTLVVNRIAFGLDWGSPRLGEEITLVGHLIYQVRTEEEKED